MLFRQTLIALLLALFSLASTAAPADFELPGLDGKTHHLSDYRGQWVLVNFWATWCPPCLEEMPELEGFHNAHRETGDALVLGINMEDVEPERLREFVDAQFVSYPILMLDPRKPGPFGRVTALPTSYLVTPQGEVVAKQVGPITAQDLEDFISNHKTGNIKKTSNGD